MAKLISKRKQTQSLNESVIQGDKHPLSIIVSLNDPDFMEMRAVELIHEAREAGPLRYRETMKQAISLLNLARIMRHESNTKD